jgi:hypothetical protein
MSVTAPVTHGELGLLGLGRDTDRPVEIVAVSDGAYRVADNGLVTPPESTIPSRTDLGLSEQQEGLVHGGARRGIAPLMLNGRHLGFYYRDTRPQPND